MIERIPANRCICDQCGHIWITVNIPKRCARCKSRLWNEDSSETKRQVTRPPSSPRPPNKKAPGYYTRKRMRRKLREEAAGPRFTEEQWKTLLHKYENKCLRCGDTEHRIVPDHIIPLSRGGSNQIHNIQPLCVMCNLWKGAHRLVDFRPVEDQILFSPDVL